LVGAAAVAAVGRVLIETLTKRSTTARPLVARARRLQRRANASRAIGWNRLPPPIRVVVPAALTTFILSGIYQTPSDAFAVGAVAVALSIWRTGFGGRLPPWLGGRIESVPPLIRVLVVSLVSYVGYLALQIAASAQSGSGLSAPIVGAAIVALTGCHLAFPRFKAEPAAVAVAARRLVGPVG
jgi:hypothetical protein